MADTALQLVEACSFMLKTRRSSQVALTEARKMLSVHGRV